jgi:hypothetical protein
MNKQTYDRITKEYGFLEDYENELLRNKQIPAQTKKNNFTAENNVEGKTYLNNYREVKEEIEEDEQLSEIEKSREKYNQTRYGKFATKDLDPSKIEDPNYLYENLEVLKKAESQTEMNEFQDKEAFQDAVNAIKKFEYRFYAYLNKEFNILNKKMIKCSMICYDDPKLFTTTDAKLCAEKCHQNIREAAKFAENLQEKSKVKLAECIEKAKEFNEENLAQDKVTNFFKCYDNLIGDFSQMEKEIIREFSYYI